MAIETWAAFFVATIVLSLIPGPSVLLVTGQALTRGTRTALLCVIGDQIGGVFLMALSVLGVGAILAASIVLFQVVKWAGVFYMMYLGYRQIVDARKGLVETSIETGPAKLLGSLKAGFLAAVLNPKAIIFYMAFLTQFVDPAGNTLVQFSILVATSTVAIGIVLSGYVLVAAQARQTFQSQRARKIFGYTGGGFLIGGSVLIATTR